MTDLIKMAEELLKAVKKKRKFSEEDAEELVTILTATLDTIAEKLC